MGKRAAVAAVLSGLLLVAGCTGDSESGGTTSTETTETNPENGTPTGPQGPSVTFGEPHKFEDGLAIEVSKPKPFRPSPNVTTGGEPDYVRFDVRLTNGTDRRISTRQVAVTVESGDGQAGDVIDVKKGLPGPPSKRVGAGDTARWALGFGVLDPDDVTVQVQVGMDRQPVTWHE